MAIAIVLLLTNTFVWHKGAGLSADADSVPVMEQSIAVLPFVNMSSDKEQEYFSDGISEELLNLLAKIPQLQVTARTSSFAFKGKETGIPEIARRLHVAHVLECSVRKAGNSVRITAQLIKAGSDTHLWSQTYDRKLDVARHGLHEGCRSNDAATGRESRISGNPRTDVFSAVGTVGAWVADSTDQAGDSRRRGRRREATA